MARHNQPRSLELTADLDMIEQVMLAHGGTATLGTSDSGGAKFTLTFLANMT